MSPSPTAGGTKPPSQAESPQNQTPDKIGPYRLDEKLGAGGMGEVYRAYDERLDRKVAIKHILPEVSQDVKVRQRLRREARSVASLNHPAIVQIYDIVESDTGDWIVMELIEGPTLHDLVEQGQLGLSLALNLLIQVTGGLAEAHANGIVHRDLKTENIMVTQAGQAKILDFGLAKRIWSSNETALSVQGAIVGTGRAMSPEQAKGEEIDLRSDIFSLGSMLYETVTGRPPFFGTSIIHTLAQVCSETQKPAREVNADVPQELSDFIDKMLEKIPDRRPQDCSEVAKALTAIALQLDPEAQSGLPQLPAPLPSRIASTAGRDEKTIADRSMARGSVFGSRVLGASTSGIFIKTLASLRLGNAHDLQRQLGPERAYDWIAEHDRQVRDLLNRFDGFEILKGDAFLVLFERPFDALRFSLAYQEMLVDPELKIREATAPFVQGDIPPAAVEEQRPELVGQVAIHVGEVFLRENSQSDVTRGARPLEVEGDAKLVVERVLAVARGGQTLLTRGAHDMARRALLGTSTTDASRHDGSSDGGFRWDDHGLYEVEGIEDTIRVLEVGRLGTRSDPPALSASGIRRVDVPEKTRRRRVLAVLAALWLVAVVATVLLLPNKDGSGTAVEGRTSVAVFEFQNLAGDQELKWLSVALAEMLSNDLAVGSDLRMVSGESIARVRNEGNIGLGSLADDTLKSVRSNLGTDYVVTGSFLRQGSQLRVQMNVQDTRNIGVSEGITEVGSADELFSLVSNAGTKLREHFGVSGLSEAETAQVKAIASTSNEATRFYSEGLSALRAYRAKEARELLQAAVEEDPNYAAAHAVLSQAWAALGYEKEAAQSAEDAFELSENLPREEQLLIKGQYHTTRSEWREAIETYTALWQFYPDNPDYALRLASVQTTAGMSNEALATLENLRMDASQAENPVVDLAEAKAVYILADYESMLEVARQAEQKARDLGADILLAEALLYKGWALRVLGRNDGLEFLEESRRLFEQVGDRRSVARTLKETALLMDRRGEVSEAEDLYREAYKIHQEIGNRDGEMEVLNHLIYDMQNRGELDEARAMAEDMVRYAQELGDPSDEALYSETLLWILYHQGDLQLTEEKVFQAQEIYERIGNPSGLAWAEYYFSEIYLARGRIDDAREALDRAVRYCEEVSNQYLAGYVYDALARVLLEAGEPEQAEEALEKSLEIRRAEGGDAESLIEGRLNRIYFDLAKGDEIAKAEERARLLIQDLQGARKNDHMRTVKAALLEAVARDGRVAEAEAMLPELREDVAKSQDPQVHGALRLAEAELAIARGSGGEITERLRRAVREVGQSDFQKLALELEVALLRVRLAEGASVGIGRQLDDVIARAEDLSLSRIVADAEELRGAL